MVLIFSILVVLCPFFNYLVITYCQGSYLNTYVQSCSHQKVSSPSETKQRMVLLHIILLRASLHQQKIYQSYDYQLKFPNL